MKQAREAWIEFRCIVLVCLASCLLFGTQTLLAQERTEHRGRLFAALGLGFDVQQANCSSCGQRRVTAGPALQGLVGISVGSGFSISVTRRAYTQFSYEYNQSSDYWLRMGTMPCPTSETLR